jgi:hypothetical protein
VVTVAELANVSEADGVPLGAAALWLAVIEALWLAVIEALWLAVIEALWLAVSDDVAVDEAVSLLVADSVVVGVALSVTDEPPATARQERGDGGRGAQATETPQCKPWRRRK